MKAIFLVRTGGGKDAFEIREIPVPVPKKGEIVVKVEAFGLNYADVMARRGLYKAAPPMPSVLGYDVAGTIYTVGPDTNGFKIGQRVAALTRFGGYAEYALTQSEAIIPLPDSIDMPLATALTTQASTAVYSARFATRIYSGDRVLIHAAAGGVGTILVQLAKAMGCIVYGSASGLKNNYLKENGVDFTLDSHSENSWNELDIILGGKKLDVIFDNIGGIGFKKGLALLGPGGRMIAYGAAAQNLGRKSSQLNNIRVGLGFGFHSPIGLIVKSQSIIGVNMLALADNKPMVIKEIMEDVAQLVREGVIHPVLGKAFPADQIGEAHDFLESRKSTGKIALSW